jgi:gamma-glutamylcyclotransferase (GGCT)/AIG2-like uncharacterized protein YtfP
MQDGDLPGPRLFVYGTLMKGSGNPMAKRLHAESAYIGLARTPGRLCLLGYYPGLLRAESKADRVFGEIVMLRNPLRSLRGVVSFDGCGPDVPERWLYDRFFVRVTLLSATILAALNFVYTRTVERASRLPAGRFVKNRPCG